MSTWKAAAYQPGTVAAWAKDIADRSMEILVRAPALAVPQTSPVLTSAEEALDALFPDDSGTGTPLAITDREVEPLGTDLEKAMLDLGEELLRPPEVGRRVRRKMFDSVVEPTGTCSQPDYSVSDLAG